MKEIKRLDGEDTKEANNNRDRFKERLAKVKEETKRLKLIKTELLKSPDQQIALIDPDARIMATTGRNSIKVGYNVQSAVDTENHLIVEHEVTNIGSDRAQLSKMALKAKDTLGCEKMDVLADKGYFKRTRNSCLRERGSHTLSSENRHLGKSE